MALNPGTKLGPYEIIAPLGAGGMGEVYRARDTRLGREVAIKVLPQHLSSNPEVRARFEREAKTVSALNHPYICVLYDVGREGDTDYLVMELVEGETLAHRIAKGPLPISDVLKVGAQIADALDRAHRAGVVHRDLKPGNIMLTRSGAKLMDFGLARGTGLAGARSGSDVSAMTQSPTVAQPLTAEGSIVGTFQYMAPEQLESRDVDARTDIWSLGCVLYEMATGKRAFEGETQASLISSIMRDEPRAMSELSPLSPPSLERTVKQCLAKDPMDRWQTAGDVRRELEWISNSSSQSMAPAVKRRRALTRGMTGIVAGALIAVAALGYSFGPWRSHPVAPSLVRFTFEAPRGTTLFNPAEGALSPDGSMIAFVAGDSSFIDHVYVRTLSSPEIRVVPGSDGAKLPFWSPDGRVLAFFGKGKLRKVALDGNAPVELCDAVDARGGAWSRAGVILFAPTNQGPIMRVSANGGAPEAVTTLNVARRERGHRYPQFLPDQKHFLYVAVGSGDEVVTYAASIDGGTPVEVCKGGSAAVWAPPGHIVYLDTGVNATHRRLLVRNFDPGTLRASGDARLLIDPASSSNFGYTNVGVSANGSMVVQHWSDPHASLVWMDRRGAVVGKVVDDIVTTSGAISPDGSRLAYNGLDPQDIFFLDLKSGISTRLTFENTSVNNQCWSPDGRRLAFARLSAARGWQIYTKATDGTGADSLLFRGTSMFNYPNAWSPDGKWLVAVCADTSGSYDLWRVPMNGPAVPQLYQHTPGQEAQATLSPDGKWLAYIVVEGEETALYVQSFPNPGAKYQVTIPSPAGAVWTRNDEIFVGSTNGFVYAVAVSTADGFRQLATNRLWRVPQDLGFVDDSPTMNAFLYFRLQDVSSLSRMEVVLNWPRLLQSK